LASHDSRSNFCLSQPLKSRILSTLPGCLPPCRIRADFPIGHLLAVCRFCVPLKRFVYILQSERDSRQPYIGLTSNIVARLREHNAGENPSTAPYKPWRLVLSMDFADEKTAIRFERYLKSGSGRGFAKRHFAPPGD
jgi:predicted GIY-YIG superfamily endonuclease